MSERDLKRKLTDIVREEADERQTAVSDSGRFTYTVTPQDGEMTVKQVLKRRMGFSSRLLRRLKTEGRVMRNGAEVRLFADVIEGDVSSGGTAGGEMFLSAAGYSYRRRL